VATWLREMKSKNENGNLHCFFGFCAEKDNIMEFKLEIHLVPGVRDSIRITNNSSIFTSAELSFRPDFDIYFNLFYLTTVSINEESNASNYDNYFQKTYTNLKKLLHALQTTVPTQGNELAFLYRYRVLKYFGVEIENPNIHVHLAGKSDYNKLIVFLKDVTNSFVTVKYKGEIPDLQTSTSKFVFKNMYVDLYKPGSSLQEGRDLYTKLFKESATPGLGGMSGLPGLPGLPELKKSKSKGNKKWISTGQKIKCKDGKTRVLYKNDKNESRVRTVVIVDGVRTMKFVGAKLIK